MKAYVYDLETLSNLFTATFVAVDSAETHVFYIHESKSDLLRLLEFLRQPDVGHIGYNSLRFDYPILHDLLINTSHYLHLQENKDWSTLAGLFYTSAQRCINAEYPEVRKWDIKIPQRDIFRIWHFDNKNRRTSLKHVEIAIQWYDVMDMPVGHDDYIGEEQIDEILQYNLNDVLATKEFYLLSQERVDMRRDLGRKYNIPMMNANDAKIGEMLMLRYISNETGVDEWTLKQLRTERPSIDLGECILSQVRFKSTEFNRILQELRLSTITETKGALEKKVYFDGMLYEFALGGLHAVRKGTTWTTTDTHTILSVDVKSYYPNLAIKNRFHPAHLGTDFCDVYEELYNERITSPKKSAINAGLKLALNGAYGKSNDQYSFLYDPKFTMQITLNGQLLLAMLCEKITLNTNSKVFMVNTDGIEVYVPNEEVEKVRVICKNWEKFTKLTLEEDVYKRLWIRDVNNYIGEFENGDIYTKGAYEWTTDQIHKDDKDWIGKDIHKDQSMLIVPRAVELYFTKGVPIRKTLLTSTNPYEFCLSMRSTKEADFYMQNLVTDNEGNHTITEEKLQRTNRFIVTRNGGMLIKRFAGGKVSRVRNPYKMQIFNVIIPEVDDPVKLGVDYDFYELECNKLISGILFQQIKLFD
jgi:hypothetical protein